MRRAIRNGLMRFFLVGAALAAGCGSGGDSTGPGGGGAGNDGGIASFVPTLAADTPLNSLTAAQAMELCQEAVGYTNGVVTSSSYRSVACQEGAVTTAAEIGRG